MNKLLNLLPWRQQNRRRRLRLWSQIAAGCLLLVMLAGICGANLTVWQHKRLHLEHEYLSHLRIALQRKYQEGQDQEKYQRLQETREAQRQTVKAWEARLITLASQLPASAWVTSLSVRKGQMVIKGNAARPADIQTLETALRKLHGISAVETGTVQHDAHGQLMFGFTLGLTEAVNASPD